MLKGDKDIDAVFRSGLSDYEVAPESYVWEAIETSLANQKQHRRTLIIWRSLAAACIAGLISLGLGVLFRLSEPLVGPTAQTISSQTEQHRSSDGNIGAEEEEYIVSDGIDTPKVSGSDVQGENAIISIPAEQVFVPKQNQARGELEEMVLLASVEKLDLQSDFDIDMQPHVKREKVYYPIYSNNIATVKKKTTISVGGVVSPAYNSKVSYGGGQNKLKSNVSLDESGINSLGGGVQVRLNKGSRWSLETGVLYSQVGQSVQSSQSYSSLDNGFKMASLNTALSNSLGSISVNKKVNSDLSSARESYVESAVMSYANVFSSVEQTLDYIEIPMIARYSLFKDFPYISVAGGLSSNFLVDNTAYSVEGGNKEVIGETNDIKPFVLSSSLGLGVDVPITKAIRFSLEPRFKYFLNSVSSNDTKSFQPYSFGVYGGITFVVH